MVYVTARPYSSPSTVAYATSCNFAEPVGEHAEVGRPIAGLVNFIPRHFNPQSLNNLFLFSEAVRIGKTKENNQPK